MKLKDSRLKTDRRKHFFTRCVVKTAENIITTGSTAVKNSLSKILMGLQMYKDIKHIKSNLKLLEGTCISPGKTVQAF